MELLADILSTIDGYIGGSQWFVFLLLGTGLFFTLYLKFPQIRYFRRAIRILSKDNKNKGKGDTSHFQALSTALSGTVGTGNIAGVAFAIHLGGPAALFWMIMTAFVGMTTKFVEVTLSHKYREVDEDGFIAGGPMYYMKNKLNWKVVAVIFAVATILSSFGTGSLPQINSIASSVERTFDIAPMLTGFVLSILLALVILGGIKRIANVTSKLVPIMAVIYFLGALAVIFYNINNLPSAFASIFADIFTGTAATGGFLGATLAFAFNRGVNRGLFSNEAGQGSAPIAHSSARSDNPLDEGFVSILEPFIDTIIICTLTGLVLLSSGVWKEKLDNEFQYADTFILKGEYNDQNPAHKQILFEGLMQNKLPLFTGELKIVDGQITDAITVLHARSVAEKVQVFQYDDKFSGQLKVENGKCVTSADEGTATIRLVGQSLIHSAPLTVEAFKRSFLGSLGEYIVTIGLLLFAFSTTIAWSYYGDRATTFLFGSHNIIYYRIVYVIGFFLASFVDTTIVWIFSGITIALMTIPNLIGILFLHKDMKATIEEYLPKN